MSDTRSPWYPWYVNDYRASRRVKKLDVTQRGIYGELLDECWIKGRIPADDLDALADIADCPVELMAENWPKVRRMFEPTPDSKGAFLLSPRLEIERQKMTELQEKRSRGGKKSAAKRQRTPRLLQDSSSSTQESSSSTAHHSTSQHRARVTHAAELPTAKTRKPEQLGVVLARLKAESEREVS